MILFVVVVVVVVVVFGFLLYLANFTGLATWQQ